MKPTLSLCMIVKDEAHNLPRLLKSVEGCFDEIHITDTGSTDNTVEIAKDAGCIVHHFDWVNDFAAARNYSFSHTKTDYIMWMDADDVLGNKDEFLRWRDNVMCMAEYWFVNYNYAYDDKGNAICTFARERVVKRAKKIPWKYFIHEGMVPEPGQNPVAQAVNTWSVNHMRTQKDIEADRGRNLKYIEERLERGEEIPTRLKFYHGKELFDAGMYAKSFDVLDSIDLKQLEGHDRILTIQYMVKGLHLKSGDEKCPAVRDRLIERAYRTAVNASILSPKRAEFHVLAGDSKIMQGKADEALPHYGAAKNCPLTSDMNPLFKADDLYGFIPSEQIARIHLTMGNLDLAEKEAKECYEVYRRPSTQELLAQIVRCKSIKSGDYAKDLKETEEIVISCMPGSCTYEWDDVIYKMKGIGGSETAAVEVAEYLAQKTGRTVIVFNDREKERITESGVHYRSNQEMRDYFLTYKPYRHIAWRHNIKLTTAPTYLWNHDLAAPGVNNYRNYDKLLCLSDFHKNFSNVISGVPFEKIAVFRNGIDTDKFKKFDYLKKEPLRVMYSSSPDRGVDRAIKVVERAREKARLNIQLHVYYGFDVMDKHNIKTTAIGQSVDELRDLVYNTDFVVYHGNVEQRQLAKDMMKSSVWLYPTWFMETFCITAIECLQARCFPLARAVGGLKDTLKSADDRKMAKLVSRDCITDEDIEFWADELIDALKNEKWRDIIPELFDHSWASVTDDLIGIMDAEPLEKKEQELELSKVQ